MSEEISASVAVGREPDGTGGRDRPGIGGGPEALAKVLDGRSPAGRDKDGRDDSGTEGESDDTSETNTDTEDES